MVPATLTTGALNVSLQLTIESWNAEMKLPEELIKPPAAEVTDVDNALTIKDVVSLTSDRKDPPINWPSNAPRLISQESDVTGPAM
jgi:hypothetical protein